jgi:hypothetical protein
VLYASGVFGVKVAVKPEAPGKTLPSTAAPPGPVTVKVVPLIVEGFIAVLKVTLMAVLIATLVVL